MRVIFEHQRHSKFQITLTPTLSRSTGRGGKDSRSPQLNVAKPSFLTACGGSPHI